MNLVSTRQVTQTVTIITNKNLSITKAIITGKIKVLTVMCTKTRIEVDLRVNVEDINSSNFIKIMGIITRKLAINGEIIIKGMLAVIIHIIIIRQEITTISVGTTPSNRITSQMVKY